MQGFYHDCVDRIVPRYALALFSFRCRNSKDFIYLPDLSVYNRELPCGFIYLHAPLLADFATLINALQSDRVGRCRE